MANNQYKFQNNSIEVAHETTKRVLSDTKDIVDDVIKIDGILLDQIPVYNELDREMQALTHGMAEVAKEGVKVIDAVLNDAVDHAFEGIDELVR